MGGDSHKYEFHGEPINQGNGKYEWKFFLVWSHVIYVEANGKDYRKYQIKTMKIIGTLSHFIMTVTAGLLITYSLSSWIRSRFKKS